MALRAGRARAGLDEFSCADVQMSALASERPSALRAPRQHGWPSLSVSMTPLDRARLKYTLEDLRPIPEVTEHERALAMARVSECQYCSRRMLTSILEEHERGCLDARNNERRVRYGRKIQVKGAQAMDCCVEPQRPRNFRVGKVTHNTIELLWEPEQVPERGENTVQVRANAQG